MRRDVEKVIEPNHIYTRLDWSELLFCPDHWGVACLNRKNGTFFCSEGGEVLDLDKCQQGIGQMYYDEQIKEDSKTEEQEQSYLSQYSANGYTEDYENQTE